MRFNQIIQGDIRTVARELPDQSVNCICTSPPYFGLRDYQTAEWVGGDEGCDHLAPALGGSGKETLVGTTADKNRTRFQQYKHTCNKCGALRQDSQMGLEESPEAYINELVGVFRELRRVLRDDGSLWLVIGDSYASSGQRQTGRNDEGPITNRKGGSIRGGPKVTVPQTYDSLKPKDLCGIPWRVALALQADGWYLRSDIIWSKPNPMPESVTDRPTKSHEYIFMLSKSPRYYFDQEAVREPHKAESLARYEYGLRATAPTDSYNMAGDKSGVFSSNRMGDFFNPSGRNKRTVWHVEDEAHNKLREILTYLAAEHPEALADIERNLSLKSDVFEVSTRSYKEAHFAVFPPKLIEPCILAGCPSRVCSECGEPWVREVESVPWIMPDGSCGCGTTHGTNKSSNPAYVQGAQGSARNGRSYCSRTKTKGFSPQCQCNDAHCPGVVLDPFFGSGTVAQVAIENGRSWLGVELNAEYIELAEKRIAGTQPALFAPDEATNGNAKAKQLTLTLDEE